ncbi:MULTISPECIES: hypothetical protein [Dyella]|uniref:Uncharacterized protein n=2 Tax=Dyella TaxID=231454 RepID=A0A4R0YNQ4_9GAMM|nr:MULTISPECIES: hypothetical protein [Dyella]TBR36192.1 hypothetical protein EYV96_16505 [Dyella terrae]TCI06241.1 hypothetical protein EZM97_35595 [Dyella soli]
MKPSKLHIVLCSATFAGVIVLSACGKQQDQSQEATPPAASTAPVAPAAAPPAPAPASTSATMPPPASTTSMPAHSGTTSSLKPESLKVTDVKLGNKVAGEDGVSEARNHFAPNDPTIYASVTTHGQTEGATLSAAWSYLEGKSQQITQTDQQFRASGPAVTTFEVRNPNLWPAGKYQVVISLNGKPVSTQPFEVSKS